MVLPPSVVVPPSGVVLPTHWPNWQVAVPGQLLPQVPQLNLSVFVSVQNWPPVEDRQAVRPVPQGLVVLPPSCGTPPSPVPGTHCPSEQKESPWQRLPQVPQLYLSDFVSVQN